MSELVILILGGLGMWVFSEILKKRKLCHLPNISDDEFLEMFYDKFSDIPSEIVINERRYIAKYLGIPIRKLSPHHTFEELSGYSDFLGSYNLAIGDFEDEISEIFETAGMEKPYKKLVTIGEAVYEIAKVKMIAL